MFETTFSVLQESPLAIVPLAIIVWFIARTVLWSGVLSWVARWVFVLGVIPPFGLFLFAELLGSGLVRDLARALLDGEVRLTIRVLTGIDSLISAVLRAFVQFVAGLVPTDLLASFMSALPSWNPFEVLSTVGFLFAVFVVHFVTGVVVIRLTQREDSLSVADTWLTVSGLVLFVSGMVWTLLQSNSLEFGRFELQIAVLASSMGLISGVAASNLFVDFPTGWADNLKDGPEGSDTPQDETTSRSETRATDTPERSPSQTSEPMPGQETDISRFITGLHRLQGAIRSIFRR
ncbi:hypothetical protein [Natrialba aegyptia]|uniref:Uncharacterized protein n=1 Tax=Natrialba aegyptia DSM 13077 TaxID=1227491 RepID=M0AM07_9EURY|nr:hypothetical protein [Natrialba aegyptia]ELY99554.1 hypothetical protein C480_19824 [Natrialba aegyptia DSM 13077]